MANTFPSLAGAKVAYLKQLKYQDFQRKRLLAHIRSQVFGSNEYLSFIPTKKTGRKLLQSRLKGPMLTSFYEDTDDKVTYSMTRNTKLNMQAITPYEQETLFTYRRQKRRFWKDKLCVQMGKLKLAEKALVTKGYRQTYKHLPTRHTFDNTARANRMREEKS